MLRHLSHAEHQLIDPVKIVVFLSHIREMKLAIRSN